MFKTLHYKHEIDILTVANPCIKIVEAIKRTKYPAHNRYDGVGKSPLASKIHDISMESAAK